MQKKKKYPSVHFGSSLMLVILLVLSLTVFATLSLVSALRDYKFSTKSAEKTYNFYQADAKANQMLAEISSRLDTNASLDGLDIVITEMDGNNCIQYQVPVNAQQLLAVTLALNDSASSGSENFRIVQWQEVSASDWHTNTSLPLLGSD